MAEMNREQSERDNNQKVTSSDHYDKQYGQQYDQKTDSGVQACDDGVGVFSDKMEMPHANSYVEGAENLSAMHAAVMGSLEKIPRMLYFKIVLERKQVIVDHSRVWIRIFLRNMQIHLILKVQNLKSFRRQKSRTI